MPHATTHTRQRQKNYLLLAVLVGTIVLLYAMTMVKLAQSPSAQPPVAAVDATTAQ